MFIGFLSFVLSVSLSHYFLFLFLFFSLLNCFLFFVCFNNLNFLFCFLFVEGEYSALEHESVKGVVESLKVVTAEKSKRIAKFAFDYATRNGRKKVIIKFGYI